MALIKFPSLQLDLVTEDILDAAAGACVSGNSEPFALADGETLDVEVDGGPTQVVTFNDPDFADIANATAAEVANVLNGALTGASAADVAGTVVITSDTFGASSSVEITGGTGAAAFAFPGGPCTGTDATDATLLINRDPEPGEVEVPVDATITLQILDSSGTPTALADIGIQVEGADAVLAGVIQPGFDGPGSGITLIDSATREVVLVPTTAFTSEQVVDVDVTITGPRPLSESYSFTVVDLTVPQVVGAQGRDKTVVRVSFSESVQAVDPTAANDALNPANYTIDRLQAPSVAVEPVEVLPVVGSTTAVDVVTDIELTFGAQYLVTVTDVEDLVSNVVTPPTNNATLTAFTPPWPAGRRFNLIEFIPQINRTEDVTEDLLRFVSIIQEVTNLLLCLIDKWIEILDPDTAPEDFLDAMLCDLGNPFDFVLTEIDKRRLLRLLVDIYKQKGTASGIINVVNFFLGVVVTIDVYNGEGWVLESADNPTADGQSPPAGPGQELSSAAEEAPDPASLGPGEQRLLYTFDIISPIDLTDEQRDRIRELAEYMKPAHTHLNRIIEPATQPAPIDHLELGASELGGATAPGTWILH